jgi:hypothetical protein
MMEGIMPCGSRYTILHCRHDVYAYSFLSYQCKIHNVIQYEIRVLIIGLGQLGLSAAKYVKEKGFEACGTSI